MWRSEWTPGRTFARRAARSARTWTIFCGAAFVVAVVRATLPAETILDDLRAASSRLVPGRQPDIQIMRDRVASTLTAPRFRAALIGAFAVTATLLGAVGLYAAMAHFVNRRRRELGVRIALGGNRADMVRLVLGRALRLSLTGIVGGAIAAVALGRTLGGFLYGVESYDPATLMTVVVILLGVSATAALLPARRAMAIDPIVALKAD